MRKLRKTGDALLGNGFSLGRRRIGTTATRYRGGGDQRTGDQCPSGDPPGKSAPGHGRAWRGDGRSSSRGGAPWLPNNQ